MGTAAGDADFLDGGAAAWTRFALTPKDARKAEVAALFALGIHVRVVGAAAFFDGEP